MIVLSDGLANQGDYSLEGLRARAGRARSGEYVLSSVGIGDAFDETVMSALADAGSGNFYYLADLQRLAGIFADEFAAARETVARALAVRIQPADGVRLASAGGYALEASQDGALLFAPGDLFAGQERRIWLTFHAPSDRPGERPLGELSVDFRTVSGERHHVGLAALPQVVCVASDAAYFASFDADVYKRGNLSESLGAVQQSVARKLALGQQAEAHRRARRLPRALERRRAPRARPRRRRQRGRARRAGRQRRGACRGRAASAQPPRQAAPRERPRRAARRREALAAPPNPRRRGKTAMKFLDRLNLLVKADAHGVLEQLEERTLLAKQHLREAELELDRKRAQLDASAEESRRLATEAERLDAEIASLDEDVELALGGDRDELARFSARKLLPKRRAVETARQRIAELDAERARLCEALTVQEAQLEELRTRVRSRIAASRVEHDGVLARCAPATDEEVEIELLRAPRGARGHTGGPLMPRFDNFGRSLVFAALAAAGLPVAVTFAGPILGVAASVRLYVIAAAAVYAVGLAGERQLAAAALAGLAGVALAVLPLDLPASALGAAAIVAGCRSLCWRQRPLRAIAIELALGALGLALARFLASGGLAGLSFAIWGYFLVQSSYFLIGGRSPRGAEPARDPFERARLRLERLLDEEIS